MSSDQPARFPTTAWSVVEDAKDWNDPAHMEAMNRLISVYRKPVFCFVRARGYQVHRAEDLTQEFFCSLLEGHWVSPADPKRGRFRNFLLIMLVRLLADQSPKRVTRQSDFERRQVNISALMRDEDRAFEPPDNLTPEKIFMKQWAQAVIGNARRALEAWCRQRGRPNWYAIYSTTRFPTAGQGRLTQEALANQLRLSRDQVRYGLEEADRQFRCLVHAEVASQVENQADTDQEIKDLYRLLGE